MNDRQELPDELGARLPILPKDPLRGNPLLRLPGLIFIGLYMLGLAALLIVRVASHHAPPFYLVLAVLFLVAGFGLVQLFRWAWALTLAAVFLPMSYCLWLVLRHQMPFDVGLVQIILNLLLFLYLVRMEVRSALR